jgi:hypothetical protein
MKDYLKLKLVMAVKNINEGKSRYLLSRLQSEIPPQDSRHLTDTRTRVSTLLEYSLSYELNNILNESQEKNSISNVLWNVFPDLIVRNSRFENIAGLEIKALHAAAEEKSANLHTPISIIRKNNDFIVIMIWGWQKEELDGNLITHPRVLEFGIFDAWIIAKIRDSTWLINENNRVKGIDVSTAIINDEKSDAYKAEEGNLGKLMRISISENLAPEFPYYSEMLAESEAYESFKKRILQHGFTETARDVSFLIGDDIREFDHIISPNVRIFAVAGNSKKIWFSTGRALSNTNWHTLSDGMISQNDVIFFLTDKLNWKILSYNSRWEIRLEGSKPDSELAKIQHELDGLFE